MAHPARYADGRAAVVHAATCEIGAEALRFDVGGQSFDWDYAELRRADDGNGRIILKRKPDTGERLTLEADVGEALRAVAPSLFAPRAFGIEGVRVVAAVAAGAWSVAIACLVGVPLMAGPIADALPERYRQQLADVSWSQVNALTDTCSDTARATEILNAATLTLMERANIERRDEIWVTIVDADFPNAFALPDNSIVVTDDLIELAETPDELMGVIAHEIAHIEHNHVMKNLVRSIGAGVFFDVVFGGAGAGQAIAIASINLSGMRYSRADEVDADAAGLAYLEAAGIDPAGLARMFERFETMEREMGELPTLFSSHPASAARAAAARSRAHAGLAAPIDAQNWQIVRAICGRIPPSPAGDASASQGVEILQGAKGPR